MWSRLYRNHVIIAFPTYDTVTNAWAPQADINWFAGSSHESKFVQFSKRCTTEEEAVSWVLRRSEGWVDNRLRRSSRAILPERGRVIDMIEAGKSHLGKVTPKQPVAIRSASEPALKTRGKLEKTRQDLIAAVSSRRPPKATHIPFRQRPRHRIS